MKVTVFQYKGKGYINLVPVVKGKVLGHLRVTGYPSYYDSILLATKQLIKEVKQKYHG